MLATQRSRTVALEVSHQFVHSYIAEKSAAHVAVVQKSPPIAYAFSGPFVHFEIRSPLQIVQAQVDTSAGVEQHS
jgi:hypothetical protein